MDIELNRDTTPEFLKSSDLYKNFDFTEEDSVFKVPNRYLKKDTKVNSIEDLKSLLHVIRFWLLEDVPDEIYDFVFENKDENYEGIFNEFDNMKLIDEIKLIIKHKNEDVSQFSSDKTCNLIENNYLNLLKYIHKKNLLIMKETLNYIYCAVDYDQYDIFLFFFEKRLKWSSSKNQFLVVDNFDQNKVNHKEWYLSILDLSSLLMKAANSKDSRFLRYLLENHELLMKECLYGINGRSDPWIECGASPKGRLENMKLFLKYNVRGDEISCRVLAEGGYLKCLKFAHENGFPWDKMTCNLAAIMGNFDCLKYAHSNGCPLDKKICVGAINSGNLDCVKYVYQNGCQMKAKHIISAVGNIECIKYLHENGCPIDTNFMVQAIGHVNLESFKYGHYNNFPKDLEDEDLIEEIDRMLCYGMFEHARFLIENNYKFTNVCLWACCFLASKKNNKEFLDFALDKCEVSSSTCYSVIDLDSIYYDYKIELLKFCIDNGCTVDEETCANAASTSLEILKYLHEIGCPWDEMTCEYAATESNLECLKYAHENGCPWDDMSVSSAALNDNYDVLEYLLKNNCPTGEATSSAAENRNYNCLVLLNKRKVEWDEDTIECCIKNYDRDCFEYAVNFGAPCNDEMVRLAALQGEYCAMRFLHLKGYEIDKDLCRYVIDNCYDFTDEHVKCLNYAIKNGSIPVDFPQTSSESDSDSDSDYN